MRLGCPHQPHCQARNHRSHLLLPSKNFPSSTVAVLQPPPTNRAPSRPSVFSSWYAAPPHRAELWQLLHLCPSMWSLHPESKCSGRLWEGLDPACLLESPLDFPLPSLPLSMTLTLTLTLPPPDSALSMTLTLTLPSP